MSGYQIGQLIALLICSCILPAVVAFIFTLILGFLLKRVGKNVMSGKYLIILIAVFTIVFLTLSLCVILSNGLSNIKDDPSRLSITLYQKRILITYKSI